MAAKPVFNCSRFSASDEPRSAVIAVEFGLFGAPNKSVSMPFTAVSISENTAVIL